MAAVWEITVEKLAAGPALWIRANTREAHNPTVEALRSLDELGLARIEDLEKLRVALQDVQGIAINGRSDIDDDSPQLRLDAIDALVYRTIGSVPE